MLIPPSGEESVVISYGILTANINNKNKSPKQNEENYTISQKSKHYKHLIGGFMVGLLAWSPWAALYSAVVAATCLEIKDDFHYHP